MVYDVKLNSIRLIYLDSSK